MRSVDMIGNANIFRPLGNVAGPGGRALPNHRRPRVAALVLAGTIASLIAATTVSSVPAVAQSNRREQSDTSPGWQRARAIILARGTAQAAQSGAIRRRAIRKDDTPTPSEPQLAIVSLSSQRIVIHGPEGVVHRSRVSSGKPGNQTPTGVFTILQRRRYHESNIYSNAPMPYMQRLTWSGIALHEGHVPNYPASHGCIRLPSGFARTMWGLGEIGMRVIVSPSDVAPVRFQHAKLPQPLSQPLEPPALAASFQLATAAEAALPPVVAPQSLSPYGAAQARLSDAKAAKLIADRAVKPAYALASEKSAEARRLAEAVKASAGILADAEDYRDTEQFGLATVQTAEAEAPILVRLRLAKAAVAAAGEAHRKLISAEAATSDEAFSAAAAARQARIAAEAAADELTAARRAVKPLSVFISRRTGMVYLRQGFHALAQEPIQLAEPDQPLGTHVYTAIEDSADGSGVRWVVVSVPTAGGLTRKQRASSDRDRPSTASQALDRLVIPDNIRQLMAERLWPGASIIVSDYGLGETNDGTDFVILTR